jgi:hypothetical protein
MTTIAFHCPTCRTKATHLPVIRGEAQDKPDHGSLFLCERCAGVMFLAVTLDGPVLQRSRPDDAPHVPSRAVGLVFSYIIPKLIAKKWTRWVHQ